MRGATITGWGSAPAPTVVPNSEVAERLGISAEWIADRTGIEERRVGGTTAGLAEIAGRAALDRAGVDPAAVDLVILATTTPDEAVPATAARVQNALGTSGAACDLNVACSGFVHGLVHAHALIALGLDKVLLIGADTLSRITDPDDRDTAVLFADGAGAVVLEAVPGPGCLLGFDLGGDGSAADLLSAPLGGRLHMEGREVFRRAVRATVGSAQRAMKSAGVEADEVALLVPHQANLRILEAAGQRLGIGPERTALLVSTSGNTSAGSVPAALAAAADEGRVAYGDVVLLVGFGAGMSWASAVLRWEDPPPRRARSRPSHQEAAG